jgi:CheY-like chemotaxis protein
LDKSNRISFLTARFFYAELIAGMNKSRILIIDDEKPILTLLKMQLGKLNLDVAMALSGKEAVEKLEHEVYDLVLTDINMPDISGIDILNFVKSKPGICTRVIGMSATPWVMAGHDFDATLVKPFDLNTIQRVVASLGGNRM